MMGKHRSQSKCGLIKNMDSDAVNSLPIEVVDSVAVNDAMATTLVEATEVDAGENVDPNVSKPLAVFNRKRKLEARVAKPSVRVANPPARVAEPPALKSDRWRLVDALGSGAFGETWRAIDTLTDTEVAIKVIPVSTEGMNMVPFIKQEARMLQSVGAQCRDNHVVCYSGMVNATLADGQEAIGLVMSMAPGSTLSTIPAPSERVLRMMARQLLGALSFLHSVGIVHRDVKPENVIVDDDNNLTLVDLGISCITCPEMYRGVVGTPQYIMPSLLEQMQSATGLATRPVYIPKREFVLGDMWAAAQTLLTKAPSGSPTAGMLRQLQRFAELGDEAGVQSIVARFT